MKTTQTHAPLRNDSYMHVFMTLVYHFYDNLVKSEKQEKLQTDTLSWKLKLILPSHGW